MFIAELFAQNAKKSAANYYTYLTTNKKSREEYTVNNVKQPKPLHFKMTVDSSVRYIDGLQLEVIAEEIPSRFFYPKTNYISREYYYIVDAPVPTKELTVIVDVSLELLLLDVLIRRTGVFKFVSDLSFLVKRVHDWYDEFGHFIKCPEKTNRPNDLLLQGIESDEQITAQRMALSLPVSYVWGAPGTGKTKTVLANCIATHIRDGEISVIAAPTNNAVDNALLSVISVLNEYGVPPESIIRLGTPTEGFKKSYGDLCAFAVLQKRIEALTARRRELEDQITASKEAMRRSDLKREFDSCFLLYSEASSLCRQLEDELAPLRKELKEQREALKSHEFALRISTERYEEICRTERTLKHKLRIFFSKRARAEFSKHKTDTENKLVISSEFVAKLKCSVKELEKTSERPEKQLTQTTEERYKQHCIIKSLSTKLTGTFVSTEQTAADFSSIKIIEPIDTSELEAELKQVDEELSVLSIQIKDKYKGKLVIACTVDVMISHYEELKAAEPSHIYLDEAAYCPLLKAGVLFAFDGASVTLLGDHMQLPPICEAPEKLVEEKEQMLYPWALSAVNFPAAFNTTDPFETLWEIYDNDKFDPSMFIPYTVLTKTYRFGQKLASILGELVFGFPLEGNPDIHTQIKVIDAPPNSVNGNANTDEAKASAEYIQLFRPDDYAVLAPYKNQVKELKRFVRSKDNVMTIHRSQGREWDTVIISVVDGGGKWPFFMTNDNKRVINTAISRARKNIVLVCDKKFWMQKPDQLIGRLVQSAD